MESYVKLGEKATGFFDPTSNLTIILGEVAELTPSQMKSKKVKLAINGGHLIRASKNEYAVYKKRTAETKAANISSESATVKELLKKNAALTEENKGLKKTNEELSSIVSQKSEGSEPKTFEQMTNEELVKYYEDNFEVSPDEIKAFKKLSQEEKVNELNELES